ncbi:hypothetical protein D3C81_735400 [compost metagenome]
MTDIDNRLFDIINFTNQKLDNAIIIENCGEEHKRLEGYYIVLPTEQISAMCIFLKSAFPSHSNLIEEGFESENNEMIIQCCNVYHPVSYTKTYIERFGGIDNLIKYGPSATSNSVDMMMDEEDPEVIKELEEEVSNLKRKLKKAEEQIASKTPDTIIDDDSLEYFIEVLSSANGDDTKTALIDVLMYYITNDDKAELTNIVVKCLESFEAQGVEI